MTEKTSWVEPSWNRVSHSRDAGPVGVEGLAILAAVAALLFYAWFRGAPPKPSAAPCIIESPGDVEKLIELMKEQDDCERFIITRPELIP